MGYRQDQSIAEWSFDPHVRTDRIEDDPIYTIHNMIPAVFICKLTTLLSHGTSSSALPVGP